MIRDHGSLENVVSFIQKDPKKRYVIPDDWPYQDARELFLHPDVRPPEHPDCDFKWEAPDVEGLVQFLVTEKGFSEDRVRSAATRLTKNLKTAQQARLEGFFKPVAKTDEEIKNLKRKNEVKKEEQKKKAKLEQKAKKESKAKPRGAA